MTIEKELLRVSNLTLEFVWDLPGLSPPSGFSAPPGSGPDLTLLVRNVSFREILGLDRPEDLPDVLTRLNRPDLRQDLIAQTALVCGIPAPSEDPVLRFGPDVLKAVFPGTGVAIFLVTTDLSPRAMPLDLGYYLTNCLHLLLPPRNRLPLHSAGVAFGDSAGLFLGPAETGKSTFVSLLGTEEVYSDDIVIVEQEPSGGFLVHPAPFGVHNPNTKPKPVRGLFHLRQGPGFDLTPLAPRDALTKLWDDHQAHVRRSTRELRTRIFNFAADLVHGVPNHTLTFSRDGVDEAALREALEGGGRMQGRWKSE